jgi:hypothetical protein
VTGSGWQLGVAALDAAGDGARRRARKELRCLHDSGHDFSSGLAWRKRERRGNRLGARDRALRAREGGRRRGAARW